MFKRKDIVTLMYEDIITIDPMGARFAASGVDKHGIDRLGPALTEQKREAKARRKSVQKQVNREALIGNTFFALIFIAFLFGRMSLGSNPIEDVQTMLDMASKLMR